MIEPTDMNESTSVKKFTSPVCGQHSFDTPSDVRLRNAAQLIVCVVLDHLQIGFP